MQPANFSTSSITARPRPIVPASNAVLRRRAKPVDAAEFKAPLWPQLIAEMFATVAENNLIGMAAPQIGVPSRLFVVHFSDESGTYGPFAVANPKLEYLDEFAPSVEGSPCIPGTMFRVPRARHVRCRGQDHSGRGFVLEAQGLLAICLQHEVDHLDGILICDYGEEIDPAEFERMSVVSDDANSAVTTIDEAL